MDVIGCHTVETLIDDSGGGIHPIEHACFSSSHHLILFFSSPIPLLPALSCLLALNNPSPPGVGGADGIAVCGCWCCVDLLASHHAMPLSRSRSFATAAAPVIGRLVMVPPMSSPPFHPPSVRCFLIASASSSRHHACVSCSPPPTAPPYLSRNGAGLRVGYEAHGCRRLACLLHAIAPSLSIWLSPISSPSSRAVLLPQHVPTALACDAVRSLRLLPR